MELLIGAGSSRIKHLQLGGRSAWTALVTLDINPDHKPDVVWDLTKRPLPFEDNTFDEIHAYEVLEHLGQQGDWRAFFEEWSEWWRILKPGGFFCGSSPSLTSPWLWGDPGHTRAITPQCFAYLRQTEYTRQIGITAMTDYRFVYQADFEPVHIQNEGDIFVYGLQAVKPSRVHAT